MLHGRWSDDVRTLALASDTFASKRDNPLMLVFDELIRETLTEMEAYLDQHQEWNADYLSSFWTEHALRMRYIRMAVQALTNVEGVLV